MSNSSKIAELNDILRKTSKGGQILITSGVQTQGDDAVQQVMQMIREYDQFASGNDPYNEHDFGAVDARPDFVGIKDRARLRTRH